MDKRNSVSFERENAGSGVAPGYLQGNDGGGRGGPLGWWYYLTAPPPVPANGSLEQREIARRGRVTSTLTLLEIIIVLVLAMPSAIATHQLLVIILLCLLALMGVALWFNRRGKLTTAGILLVVGVGLSIPMSIITTPGGLQPKTILLYDLLIQTDLVAVSVLPAYSVFIVATLNSAFILGDIIFQTHAPTFDILLAQAGPEVVAPPVVLHLLVAIVTYIWVRSANQAINRADRAEVIARLQHDLAERDRDIALQKQLLEADIRHIENTHQQIANGNLSARVPVTSINMLWGIAGKLNNLLTRFQRLQQLDAEMYKVQSRLHHASQVEADVMRVKNEVLRQVERVRIAKSSQSPFLTSPTGTVIDPLLAELHTTTITAPEGFEVTYRHNGDR